MNPAEIEKALAARVAEAVEKAMAERPVPALATNSPSPVIQTKAVAVSERVGVALQADFARRAMATGHMEKALGEGFIQREANLNPGTGLELNGATRTNELVTMLREQSFMLNIGARVIEFDSAGLIVGKLNGGFNVVPLAPTESPPDSTPDTEDLELSARYHAGTKMSVSNTLLRNPQAASQLATDAVQSVANFVDDKIINGVAAGNVPAGIKAQTASSHKVARTVNGDTNKVLADIGKGIGKMLAAKHRISDIVIVMGSPLFASGIAARDGAGMGFPTLTNPQPTLFGRPVYIQSAVGNDVMLLDVSKVLIGLHIRPNVKVGLEGINFSSETTTVYARAAYQALLTHDTAAYFITNAGDATGWFTTA